MTTTPTRTVFLDSTVSETVELFLKERGVAITSAFAERVVSSPPTLQLRHAAAHGWPLLSTDRQTLFRLHNRYLMQGWPHSGIITVAAKPSLRHCTELRCAMILDWVAAESPDSRNRLFRWADLHEQLVDGETLPGYTADEIAIALGGQA